MIEGFYDLQDPVGRTGFYLYNKGDVYPRDGMEPAPGRIASLLSASNSRGNPLIALIEEMPEKVPEEVSGDAPEEPAEEAAAEPAKKQKKRRQKTTE